MDEVGPLLTAILAANLLTAMFLYGAVRASRIKDHRVDSLTFGALMLPMAFLGMFVLVYWL